MRRFLASLSLACLLAVPAAAQEATSGVDFGHQTAGTPPINLVPIGLPDQPVIVSAPTAPATAPAGIISKDDVESTHLADIDPDSTGVLFPANGGFGATLWSGTSRPLVERMMQNLDLPTSSPTLNHLVRRVLLTTAAVPTGAKAADQSFTALRVEKLLSLGDTDGAAQLAALVKPAVLPAATRLRLTEALLLKGKAEAACPAIPAMIQENGDPAWQKLLILCQLGSGNATAAQLSIDLLRDQMKKDAGTDIFLDLLSHNVQNGSKQLPRRLTPIKASTLALLKQIALPLPSEIFGKWEGPFVPALLAVPAANSGAKLAFAEAAAQAGLIAPADLAAVYKGAETGPSDGTAKVAINAALYQELLKQTEPSDRLFEVAESFFRNIQGNAVAVELLADRLKDVPLQAELKKKAAFLTQVFAYAGQPKQAIGWYKIALTETEDRARLQSIWPLLVIENLLSATEYSQQLNAWLDTRLKDATPDRRQRTGDFLLFFNAAGYAVPDEAWARVAENAGSETKASLPADLWIERLRSVAASSHRGETLLLAVLLAGGTTAQSPAFLVADAIRALRLNDLADETTALAREAFIARLTSEALTAPRTP